MPESNSTIREIQLTRGMIAIVDAEDYERVSAHKWHAVPRRNDRRDKWYAHSSGIGKLHRFIMNAPKGVMVDHRNDDGLDCRRSNMRLASNSQNQANCKMAKHNTSGFRGVCASRGKWLAQIQVEGRQIGLGRFATPEEAAHAYDAKVRETRGEFGRTNF